MATHPEPRANGRSASLPAGLRFPKLRAVDIRPHRQNGHDYLLLRDVLALSEQSLLVPRELAVVLALCDGTMEDEEAISRGLRQRFGYHVDGDTVAALLRAMDDLVLLDNYRYRERLQAARADFHAAPFRRPTSAGLSYPQEPDRLSGYLDDLLSRVPARGPQRPAVHGVFSPHIDYARGGAIYAQTWYQARELVADADLVVLIGTDHYGDDPFTLTRQSYATPYGVLPTPGSLVDDLAQGLGEQIFDGELRHIGEHSIELVAVWLHHMRGGKPVELLPVLVGSYARYYGNGLAPHGDVETRHFLDLLHRHSHGRRVAVVASGDMAHVGPAFGGAPLDPAGRDEVGRADQALMDRMQAGDSRGFFDAVKRVQNRYNVCGVTPFYLGMELLGQVEGEVTGYASCPADEVGQSAVTICGLVY